MPVYAEYRFEDGENMDQKDVPSLGMSMYCALKDSTKSLHVIEPCIVVHRNTRERGEEGKFERHSLRQL